MEYQKDRAWLEIDLGRICQNYTAIRGHLPPGSDIIAVIKADAYGLGALPVARALEALDPPLLAVATLEEAMHLREHGIQAPIMLMGPMPLHHLELAIDRDIQLYLTDAAYAHEVSRQAAVLSKRARGHLVVDVGLSRFGIPVEHRFQEALADVEAVLALPNLEVVAIAAHLTGSSRIGGQALDRYQGELFKMLAQAVRQGGREMKFHLLSTVPLLHMPEYCFDYVRVGSLFLGLMDETPLGTKPAVRLKTVIGHTRRMERGALVSYGPDFTALRPTRAAVLPIGYADGLRRSLSGSGCMLVRGQPAPIMGKICCDFTILDITDIEDAQVGDVVTIWGRDGAYDQSVSTYAQLYPASLPEVTAALSPRIPRFYI